MITDGLAETAFAAVATYEFLWRDTDPAVLPGSGPMVGLNHDLRFRPRRQDRPPHFRETGAFYAMTVAGLRESGHRFFGRTHRRGTGHAALEIDPLAELRMADAIASMILPAVEVVDEPVDVDAVITDFDGVHTDDAHCRPAWLGVRAGEPCRRLRGGQLKRLGIPFVIISTEVNPVVSARASKLGVRSFKACRTSGPRCHLAPQPVSAGRAAYLGNDLNDQAAMSYVGWPIAVRDARPEIRQQARLVLTRRADRARSASCAI